MGLVGLLFHADFASSGVKCKLLDLRPCAPKPGQTQSSKTLLVSLNRQIQPSFL